MSRSGAQWPSAVYPGIICICFLIYSTKLVSLGCFPSHGAVGRHALWAASSALCWTKHLLRAVRALVDEVIMLSYGFFSLIDTLYFCFVLFYGRGGKSFQSGILFLIWSLLFLYIYSLEKWSVLSKLHSPKQAIAPMAYVIIKMCSLYRTAYYEVLRPDPKLRIDLSTLRGNSRDEEFQVRISGLRLLLG